MKKVLIAYATNSGSTQEVAEFIAAELGKLGALADTRRLEEVTGLEAYDTVVIGAPLLIGWHRAAIKFIKQHQRVLSQKKVAYFFTGMSLTQTDEKSHKAIPIYVDRELVKPPQNPTRLSIKERYATISNYLSAPLKAAPLVKPIGAAFFGGKLELFRLNFFQMLFVMVVIQAQPGDRRNWDAIQEWAASLQTTLLGSA